jgi:spermidine/putrescine transport system permease protein
MAWIVIFTAIPLLLVLYYSFQTVGDAGIWDNYRQAFEPLYLSVLWRSIRLALVCTILCFVLGYPVGYILASKEFSARTFILFLFVVPMWMNFLLRTYAWLTILETNGIINNLLYSLGLGRMTLLNTEEAVALGMVYNFIPFMILPIYTVMKRMDGRVIEAAQDLGANPLKVFLKVTFPLSLPGVISGVTMVFMPAVTTFIISDLLGGGSVFLIGNVIERQFLAVGDWGFASALSTILMAILLVSVGVFSLFDRNYEERGQEGGVLH